MRKKDLILILLVATSIVLSVAFAVVSATRGLSNLESVMLQLFTMALGIGASVAFGQESARGAAEEIIKPHARSAFRRLLSLYGSLSRMAAAIDEGRPRTTDASALATLDKLGAIAAEQIATADDALEDWSDIVPEEVEELRQRLSGRVR